MLSLNNLKLNALGVSDAKSSNPLLEDFSGAVGAWSLRKIGSVDNVVRVRRSTNNAESNFTAGQIINGSLLNWAVGENVVPLYNNSMYFDGVDDFVTSPVAFPSSVNTTTVEVGATFTFLGSARSILCGNYKGQVPTTGVINLEITTEGFLRFFLSDLSPSPQGVKDVRTVNTFNDGGYYEVVALYNGTSISITVNGVVQTLVTTVNNSFSVNIGNDSNTFLIGTDGRSVPYRHIGVIKNVYVKRGGVELFRYEGNGNTNADWLDQVGSNNGTVSGSPALFTGQGYNGFVTTLYDQSGNSRNFVQTVAINQPLLVENGAITLSNGKPAIKMGLDRRMKYVDGGALNSFRTGPLSAFSVAQLTERTGAWQAVWMPSSNNTGNGAIGQQFFSSTANHFGCHNTNNTSIGIFVSLANTLNQYLHIMTRDNAGVNGNGSNVYLESANLLDNPTKTEVQSWTSAGGTQFTLGKQWDQDGDLSVAHWRGFIQEVVLFGEQKTTEIAGIKKNINRYYKIY